MAQIDLLTILLTNKSNSIAHKVIHSNNDNLIKSASYKIKKEKVSQSKTNV